MALRDPIIAIAGRPNVGKSTLFNAIVGQRLAIVEDQPGVTRDRHYAFVDSGKVPFFIVDTGGLEEAREDEIGRRTIEQTLVAVEEADVIVVVFDGSVGVQPGDEEVVNILRRYKKQIFYVVNKCDGPEQSHRKIDFYSIAPDELYDISALYGGGITALVNRALESLPNYQQLLQSAASRREHQRQHEMVAEEVVEQLAADYDQKSYDEEVREAYGDGLEQESPAPQFAPVFIPLEDSVSGESEEAANAEHYIDQHRWATPGQRRFIGSNALPEPDWLRDEEGDSQAEADVLPAEVASLADRITRVALVGRPNVGKSTIVNALLGEKRMIVSAEAGTTRDSVGAHLKRDGVQYMLVDTAGLRKKARVEERVERYSVLRSLRAIAQCDVAVVVVDATQGATEQDAKIAGLAHERGRGLVFVVNKWDLVEKDHRTVQRFTSQLRETCKFATYAPIVFSSAISGRRALKILDYVKEVAEQRLRRVSTSSLNRLLMRAVRGKPSPTYRGEPIRLYYGTQTDVAPPTFALFFSQTKGLHFSYLRFLRNVIRNEFDFKGTEIKLLPRRHRG